MLGDQPIVRGPEYFDVFKEVVVTEDASRKPRGLVSDAAPFI